MNKVLFQKSYRTLKCEKELDKEKAGSWENY
jgi:hypothetical protein